MFKDLLVQMKRAPKYVRDVQAEWLSIAEKRLAACSNLRPRPIRLGGRRPLLPADRSTSTQQRPAG